VLLGPWGNGLGKWVARADVGFDLGPAGHPGHRDAVKAVCEPVRVAVVEDDDGREHGPGLHGLGVLRGDPFDRLLIAQALVEDLTLVSNETLFDSSGVKRLW
jgi:hypothetical protein